MEAVYNDRAEAIKAMVFAFENKYGKGIETFKMVEYCKAAFGVQDKTAKGYIDFALKNNHIAIQGDRYIYTK